MNELTQTFAASGPDNKPTVFNAGLSRISGTNLMGLGKKINWLYVIIEIDCIAFYQNQGADIWIGGNGLPVAGNTAVLTSLIPFEEQKFYNIQTQQALQYKGGAWGGVTASSFQLISPTTLIKDASAALTLNRDHLIVAGESAFTLPLSQAQNGAQLRFVSLPSVHNNTVVAPAGTVIANYKNIVSQLMSIVPGFLYNCYFYNSVWYVLAPEPDSAVLRPANNLADLEDAAAARANLDVLAAEQVNSLVNSVTNSDGSIEFVGNAASGDRRARVVFATPAQFEAGATGVSLDPATVRSHVDGAVAVSLGVSQFNNITGLTGSSYGFNLSILSATTLGYTTFTGLFNPDPYLRSSPVDTLVFNGGSVAVPNIVGRVKYYVLAGFLGTVYLDTTYDVTNHLTIKLGYCLAEGGNLIAVVTSPQLASSDKAMRTSEYVATGGTLKPTPTGPTGTLSSAVLVVNSEGRNWVVDPEYPHVFTRALQNIVTYAMVNDAGEVLASDQTYVNGQGLQDGSSVAASAFSFQVMYTDVFGRFYLLQGKNSYANVDLAISAALTDTPAIPAYLMKPRELGRLVLRGDQHFGNAALDLTDATKFGILSLAVTGIGSAADTEGVEWRYAVGGGLLQPSIHYILKDSGVYTLPPVTASTQYVTAKSIFGTAPVLTVSNTSTELLKDEFTGETGTSVTLDVPGQRLDAVSDLTMWRF